MSNDKTLYLELECGATIVTATKHLARNLRQHYDRAQRAKSISTWNSADIVPWGTWLIRLWHQCETSHILINDWQQRVLWQDIISNDINKAGFETAVLWDYPATARTAMNAWQILHQWSIPLSDCAASWHLDHRCFYRWARVYRDELKRRNYVDAACLPDRLTDFAEPISGAVKHIVFHGFDTLTPQQNKLIDSFKAVGLDVRVNQHIGTRQAKVVRVEASTSTFEWQAAGQWARAQLMHDPQMKIAIITPNLARHRLAIERQLMLQLMPSAIQRQNSTLRPFHFSLGRPLAAYSIIDDALLLLSLATLGEHPFESYSQLIRSPFLVKAKRERLARHKLELWCRQHCPWQLSFTHFIQQLQSNHSLCESAPVLIVQLKAAQQLKDLLQNRQTFVQWRKLFSGWLTALSWPGDTDLDSSNFQLLSAWHDLLAQLVSLDQVQAPVHLAEALTWLRQEANNQVFQTQAKDVSVQVMDIYQTAGLFDFDVIWFGGLTESDWPEPRYPNPFIPISIQRDIGIEAASVALNTQLSMQMQKRLLSSTREIILSSPLFENGIELEVSPLIADFPCFGTALNADSPAKRINRSVAEFEYLDDDFGLAVDTKQASGGVSVITDQANCPFRAYAMHRLYCTFAELPQPGVNALDRGSLVHRSLEQIWVQIRNSDRLASLLQAELSNLITRSIRPLLKQAARVDNLGYGQLSSLEKWLHALLMQWFEVERSRYQPFTIDSLESKQTIVLAGLQINLRIDRIDRLQDGSLVIIDYKTSYSNIADWVGTHPTQPQLPLYALTRTERVEAISFAHLKAGKSNFVGICHQHAQGAGMPTWDATRGTFKAYASWEALVEHWHQSLTDLAAEFGAGLATVIPKQASTCRYCNLHSLCRITQYV